MCVRRCADVVTGICASQECRYYLRRQLESAVRQGGDRAMWNMNHDAVTRSECQELKMTRAEGLNDADRSADAQLVEGGSDDVVDGKPRSNESMRMLIK